MKNFVGLITLLTITGYAMAAKPLRQEQKLIVNKAVVTKTSEVQKKQTNGMGLTGSGQGSNEISEAMCLDQRGKIRGGNCIFPNGSSEPIE